jgi:hypothetical protein
MKIILHTIICFVCCYIIATCLTACSEQDAPSVDTNEVKVQLTGLDDDLSGFEVQLRNINTGSVFIEKTNTQGIATFTVTPGLYEALTSQTRNTDGNEYYSYNGTSGQITVRADIPITASIPMKRATISRLVIKELYCGGCMADDGVTSFQYDKCVILYNNSAEPASYDNLCFGMSAPANAQANNNNYLADGRLSYEGEGFTPLWNGIWYFPSTLTIDPYSEIVVNIHGAIDNTLTYSQSVNYANANYYCMFDPESGYNNQRYYPTPSEVIPTSHYLKAVVYGQGNAWPLSNSSPALVLFQTKDVAPAYFAQNYSNYWYDGEDNTKTHSESPIKRCVKVPNSWIIDAIEVFSSNYATQCMKRLTADIDAGYVWMTNKKGHSIYRNVDQQATEQLSENEGKLVYGCALGVDNSTDSSCIDAEASIQKGAHIIYQNTNNATNDFHERQLCSLRN